MKYKRLRRFIVITVMALATMPMAWGAAFADSGSGIRRDSNEAEMFLGSCPGGPCARVDLELRGGTLEGEASGFGFPLDFDRSGTRNRYALCVQDIFVGDDRVESAGSDVVEDDGEVDIDGEASVNFTGLRDAGVTIVDIGDISPGIGSRDASCTTGSVLLSGVVGFINLQ